MTNVESYWEYKAWLEEPYEMEKDKLSREQRELQTSNNILRTRNENLAKSPEAYVKVAQSGSIIETKREILTQNPDGTIRASVLTEQFANITKRKTEDNDKENEENINSKKTKTKNRA